MRNSSLYKDEGIVINSQWANQYNKEIEQEQNLDDACSDQSAENVENSNNSHSERIDDDDHLSESEDIVPAGVKSTDFLEDNERQHIFNIAPAEGNIPLSVFRDKFSEELAYPGIFLGQPRTLCKQIHYSDICKSELRSDRRAAMCVENIFYKAKKLQMKILSGKSTIALRKCKGNNRNLNARQLKHTGAVDRLIRYDEGFKFLTALRGSPPYFEKATKELSAL